MKSTEIKLKQHAGDAEMLEVWGEHGLFAVVHCDILSDRQDIIRRLEDGKSAVFRLVDSHGGEEGDR